MTPTPRSKRRRSSNTGKIMAWVFGPVGIALLMAAIIGGFWYRDRPQAVAFDPNTAVGKAAMTATETFPNKGRTHVKPGETVNYDSDFPTSGPHDPNPVLPGIYTEAQRPEQLVHSLEHGNIVIYVDQPGQMAMDTLTAWAKEFPGAFEGLVVVPKPGLGKEVVLTAWTKKLVSPEFEPEAAATFIDAYRGRGPEDPVR